MYYWIGFPCCIVYNLCIPAMARRPELGGPVVYLLRAVAMPLTVIVFTLDCVMGKDAKPFQWPLALGVLIVAGALLTYYFQDFKPLFLKLLCCRPRRRRLMSVSRSHHDDLLDTYNAATALPPLSDVASLLPPVPNATAPQVQNR
jgi:hypothetical protein